MKEKLNKLFSITERGSTIGTEFIAGFSTFAAMAYILALQPMLMSVAGMDPLAVFIAVALISGLATIAMGIFANLPIALSTAIGANIILAYTIVAGGITTWQVAMGMMFISGILFFIVSVLKVREKFIYYIPKTLRFGIVGAIGFLLIKIGFVNSKLILPDYTGFAPITEPSVKLALIGVFITIITHFIRIKIKEKEYKIRGAALLSIILTTIIGLFMGVVALPQNFFSTSTFSSLGNIAFKLDIVGALRLSFIPFILAFFIADFIGTLGLAIAVSRRTGLMDNDGNIPKIGQLFLVDATATVVGTLFGLTTISSFAESGVGVEAGGRTGLSSVFTGLFFLLCIFIAPIFLIVPNAATAPVLIYIGMLMLQEFKNIDFTPENWIPVAAMSFITLFADFGSGLAIGLLIDTVIRFSSYLFSDDRKKDDIPSFATVLITIAACLQFFL